MRSAALGLFLLLAPLAGNLAAAPFGPGDRASIETMLGALAGDPFAEAPLTTLERIYERGPGYPALLTELRRRAEGHKLPDLIVLGRLELGRGHREAGVKPLAEAAALASDPRTERRLARLLDDNGARADAIAAYRIGLSGASALEQRGIQLRIGALMLADGKAAEARTAWEAAKKSAPEDQALRRQIAEALATRGFYADAIAELSQLEVLVEKEPFAHALVLRREADFARRAADKPLSDRLLIRAYLVAARLPQSALRAELTVDLMQQHRVAAGVPKAVRARGLDELQAIALRAEKSDPVAAALLGDVLIERGDRPAAVAAFHRALTARHDDAYVLRRLSTLETGDQRIVALRALFDVDRNDATCGLDLVAALLEMKRVDDAILEARQLRARFPDNPVLLAELARLLSKRGRHAEALQLEEHVLRLTPDQPDALIAYGDELRALNRGDEAVKQYRHLVARDTSPVAYRQLITVLAKRNLPAEVKRAYQDGLLKSPRDFSLHRDYARWLTARSGEPGALDEAIAEWELIAKGATEPLLRDFAKYELASLQREKVFR